LVRDQVIELQQEIRRSRWDVVLCPEITGKPSQFGSVAELDALIKDTGCGLTVDFAHLYARQQGVIDYDALMPSLPKAFHAHFSGIAYTTKGEKRHTRMRPAHFRPLLAALVRHHKKATIICESPEPFQDAVVMHEMVTQQANVSRVRS
jgi:deoxyribonuclease-4